jgi:hypothetical protein
MLVAAAALLAACGGSPAHGIADLVTTTAASPGSAAQAPLTGAVRFANCMRSHGVTDYPDPASNGRPQSLKQIDPSSPTFLAAYRACQKYAQSGAGIPPEPSPAELHAALAFAQCVRTHGFPQFPDPLTTESPAGTFMLGPGMYFPVNRGYQVQSAAFLRAAKACGVQLP